MKSKVLLTSCLIIWLLSSEMFSQTVCSYKYRKRITFDATKVGGSVDLIDFPALIDIGSDNDLRTVANSGHVENNNGFDIVFTAADGVTLLEFEMETYTANTGKYTAWVKVPRLSASINTVVYIYYGNSAIVTNQSSSAVWSNYNGVWHLQNGSFADSSPNGYNCTNNGSTNQPTAVVNNGRAFNGTQWLEVSNSFPNKNSNFTISGWLYTNNNTTQGQRLFCDDVNNTGGYALSLGDGGTGRLRFYSRGSTNIILDSPANTILNNTWYYCVGVANTSGNLRSIFVNGVQVATVTSVGMGTDAGNCSIGGETAAGETANRINGRLDEVRVANSVLSAAWLLTEYNNQSSPSTFYSIASEPTMWTGAVSTLWANNGNWLSGTAPAAGTDATIDNVTNQAALNTNIQLASLWVRSGAVLTLNNTRTLSIAYDITNCGTITGNNTSVVQLNASSANLQNQNLSGNGNFNLANLTVNNTFSPSPGIILNKNVNVSSNLLLTSGVVYTGSTNILALTNTATASSGSSLSYVSGPMSKSGTVAFVFPVGKGDKWRRVGISAPTTSSNFRAEYFNTAFSNTSSVNTPINNVSQTECWQLDRLTGTGNASVSLFWEDATESGINNCGDLTIARWNGSAWDERVATAVPGSTCIAGGTGTLVTNGVVNAFSPFTFASRGNGVNPLPVELLSFSGICEATGINLKWVTATERKSDRFIIEWSSDGINWTQKGSVAGIGESDVSREYYFKDNLSGEYLNYYRLIEIDTDKNKKILQVIHVLCAEQIGEKAVLFYPNPLNDVFYLRFNPRYFHEEAHLEITDNLGRIILQFNLRISSESTNIKVPVDLKPGAYQVLIKVKNSILGPEKLLVR
jgi:hypothetical protein